MERPIAMSYATLAFVAIAIVARNQLAPPAEHDGSLQIPALVFLALLGVGLFLFTAGESVGPRGKTILAYIVLMSTIAFLLGTIYVSTM